MASQVQTGGFVFKVENGNSGFKITVSSYGRLKVCLALSLSWFLKIYPLGLLFHVTVPNHLPEIFCCLVFEYCILDGEEDLL